MSESYPDILNLQAQLAQTAREAEALADLPEALAAWRPNPTAWTIAECLDHLAATNRAYLAAMQPPAAEARTQSRLRKTAATPGLFGRLFISKLDPPVKSYARMKSPRSILPREAPPLADALAGFQTSHASVCAFLAATSGLDLARIVFPNPFIPGIRFSLATGLHIIAAHERRHLWQAWQVRRAAEGTGA